MRIEDEFLLFTKNSAFSSVVSICLLYLEEGNSIVFIKIMFESFSARTIVAKAFELIFCKKYDTKILYLHV